MNNNQITIKGTIKRDLEQKTNSRGEPYCFTFLAIEDHEKDIPVFLWNPNYETILKAEEELKEETEVALIGKWNNDQSVFHFTDWQLNNLEIF